MIAAIYARKSAEQFRADDEAKSVQIQISNARAFANARGWTVADAQVYADDAVSGAETRKLVNRQQLLDVLAAAGRPPFQVLIMRDASRFSRRDGDEAFGELKRIAQRGIDIWFYQDAQRFTYGTFGDNVVGFVRAEMNAEYRRQIAKLTHEAFLRKAKAGHVTGGRAFGYDNVCSKCDRVIPIGAVRCCREGHTDKQINDTDA
jgi:DNA invertase Pin-like site-specific DNA recombinase